MSGGQEWASEAYQAAQLEPVQRPEQVIMLRDDCREMLHALGVDVWRSDVAARLKAACQRTQAACDEWLAMNTGCDRDQVDEPAAKWQPISPTLAGK